MNSLSERLRLWAGTSKSMRTKDRFLMVFAAHELVRLTTELDQALGDVASIRDDKNGEIERLTAIIDRTKTGVT